MPPFPEEVAAAPVEASAEYSILKQRVDLDVDFARRSLKGSTEITVQPLAKNLKQIRLHCRQCRPTAIQVGGITAKWEYDDPYRKARMPDQSDVRQHDMLKSRVEKSLRPEPQPELVVTLPPRLKIQELQADVGSAMPLTNGAAPKQESDAVAETPTVTSASQGPQFAPIKLFIDFEIESFRDGIHWIGYAEGDMRFPYMYTKSEPWAGNLSNIFPCVDDATSRCSWDISIRCARTLGDAFRTPKEREASPNGQVEGADEDVEMANGTDAASKASESKDRLEEKYLISLNDEDASLDLSVICIGDIVDDVVDTEDDTHHTVSFSLTQPVTARHVGFAIGPFEHVNLSSARDSEEEERLGQSAFKIDGYCLPGKSKQMLNTCYPIAWAMDHMGVKYGSFPFSSYQIIFVDDFVHDTIAAAGLSFCSTHLLFPKTVIEPIYRSTRKLVQALADQWIGVNVIAKEPTDAWVVAGISGFMTDAYMRELCGNNEFRWQQKLAAEKVYDTDVDRPSIRQLGELLHLDASIRDFVNVKSALVLFILDRRLMKTSGNTGVQRIINKIFLNAKTGALVNGEVSTAEFQRTCERLGHNKLELFFKQWVFHSGVPIFYVTQRFNKKKLVVEMTIVQKQLDRVTKPEFAPSNFMREVKEHVGEVWAPETNPVFTGPMTIRIHEADGTPYEHIVEIKEATTRLEIPYNTKYKRLKRSRRQRERQQAQGQEGEGAEDALLYCLGDILDSEEEKREWNLADWTEEDEEKMGQESYEWIRMDADFEWIGKIHLVMPLYMYISQLQQDRDIVAQYESMRYLLGSNPHHVSLTILVRTLIDERYFWGIRELAADGLAICAKDKWRDIGQFHLVKAFRHLFCVDGTNMPKSNDFSDRRRFILQCAIPRAMSKLRDVDGKVPMSVRQFFIDLLKFNDNSNNTVEDNESGEVLLYSDNHYIATLMKCLADALIASHREPQPSYTFSFGDDDPMDEMADTADGDFEKLAIAQIERHRRIDEWDPSYHNLYSVTALECLQRLTNAGIVKDKTAEVMKYVRSGNADNVRLAAWRCLSEVGVLRKMPAMQYLLYNLRTDLSPRFRDRLMGVLGESLGHIAFGDPEPAKVEVQPPADGLVLEQEVSSETRRIEATRKTTPEGALLALQTALSNELAFGQSIWDAAISRDLMLDEVTAFCDIAALIYEPVDSYIFRLKLPRKWRCENMGGGKVKFIPHGPYRDVPRKPLTLQDHELLKKNELHYTGPLSPEAQEKVKATNAAELQRKIAEKQKEIEQAQQQSTTTPSVEMPPPSAVAPPPPASLTERTPSFKINLGNKRKQSVDLDVKPGSPKAQKTSRQQSPAESIQSTPRRKNSPAQTQRRSTTPNKARAGKPKWSLQVTLQLGANATRAKEILSQPPRPNLTAPTSQPNSQSPAPPPVLPQQNSSFPTSFSPAPEGQANYFPGSTFAASPLQPMNLGGFRSYEPNPVPEAEVNGDGVKMEETEPDTKLKLDTTVEADVQAEHQEPDSPDVPLAMAVKPVAAPAVVNGEGTNGESTGADGESNGANGGSSGHVEEQAMPPPPRPKLTLKLGSRRGSTQGSPE